MRTSKHVYFLGTQHSPLPPQRSGNKGSDQYWWVERGDEGSGRGGVFCRVLVCGPGDGVYWDVRHQLQRDGEGGVGEPEL